MELTVVPLLVKPSKLEQPHKVYQQKYKESSNEHSEDPRIHDTEIEDVSRGETDTVGNANEEDEKLEVGTMVFSVQIK